MKENEHVDRPLIITLTWVMMIVYNVFYWLGKFFRESLPSMFGDFYMAVGGHWYLITFLEFLGLASLFADLVIRWDKMSESWRKIQLVITIALAIGFMIRVITGMMDIFLTGELR